MTGEQATYCKPCGGFDATPDKVLVKRGTCGLCGKPDQVLYVCPKRALPGLPCPHGADDPETCPISWVCGGEVQEITLHAFLRQFGRK